MTLKRLSCLVLAVVLGTAFSVQSYLEAAPAAPGSQRSDPAQVSYSHVSVPMRAEPARRPCSSGQSGASSALIVRERVRLERARPESAPAPAAVPAATQASPAPSAFRTDSRS